MPFSTVRKLTIFITWSTFGISKFMKFIIDRIHPPTSLRKSSKNTRCTGIRLTYLTSFDTIHAKGGLNITKDLFGVKLSKLSDTYSRRHLCAWSSAFSYQTSLSKKSSRLAWPVCPPPWFLLNSAKIASKGFRISKTAASARFTILCAWCVSSFTDYKR